MLRALGSASCDIIHETWYTICYGHWVLHLVISGTKQEIRFVTGNGAPCLVTLHTRQEVRCVTDIWLRIL